MVREYGRQPEDAEADGLNGSRVVLSNWGLINENSSSCFKDMWVVCEVLTAQRRTFAMRECGTSGPRASFQQSDMAVFEFQAVRASEGRHEC